MNYRAQFVVKPGKKLRLSRVDPASTGGHLSQDSASAEIQEHIASMDKLQALLYADASRSLLVVLQGLDAAGKDGTIRHLFRGMDPQGTTVWSFKPPSAEEAAHEFLWRAHLRAPAKGQVVIFNRSHYEDVLVTRVHKLIDKSTWSQRYELINDFEKMLTLGGTVILKFFLHISPTEQLARFKERLDDPRRNWKISDSDYAERELWDGYMKAYEDAIDHTSTDHAPWYVIPSDAKWFRNLAISQIVADALVRMDLKVPRARVDLEEIRRKYHAAESELAGTPKPRSRKSRSS